MNRHSAWKRPRTLSPRSSAYQNGVSYLLRTQLEDGTWFVRSRAFGFQPYFESGFPHGTDQFIWIVSYDGPKSFQEADAAYYQSPDRKAIDPDPARHLAHTQTRLMTSA